MIKYSRCKENNYHTDYYTDYNLPDKKPALYCKNNKKTKKCIEENCSK